jgi:hypothetical protein
MTEGPGYDPEQIMRGLGPARRVGILVAGLSGVAGAATIALLWATEPNELPARTQLAFAALIGMGMAWAGVAGWTLARRPLFALDRVIAGWLAVTFTTLTTLSTVMVALTRSSSAGVLACGGLGLVLIVVASIVLIRARAYRAALLARRRELEAQQS